MATLSEPVSTLLGAFVLLTMSIYTMGLLRKEPERAYLRHERRFLFEGKESGHALASLLGGLFSVTYFFGAVFIYGHVFGNVLVLMTAVVVLLSGGILLKLTRAASASLPRGRVFPPRSNLLLSYVHQVHPGAFRSLAPLYGVIYFALLVEELAVSRLVLGALFPWNPLVGATLLFVLCLVVYVYLAYGGFKAVLASDLAQLSLLVPFVVALVFLILEARAGDVPTPRQSIAPASVIPWVDYVGLVAIGVAWLTTSVDVFSRLNFRSRDAIAMATERSRLIVVSLGLLFIFVTIGAVFGTHLRGVMATPDSPSHYTQAAVAYFMGSDSLLVRIAFLAGIICAIFTTIDSLLVTVLQVTWYCKPRWWGRRHLGKILLVAVLLASFLPGNSVSAVGIFIASLLMLPALVYLTLIFRSRFAWLPADAGYVWPALALAIALFAASYRTYELAFAHHFELPILVFLSGCLCLVPWTVVTRYRRG